MLAYGIRILTVVALAWAALANGMAGRAAAEQAPEVLDAAMGLGGVCRVGYWTPLRLTIAPGSAGWRVSVEVWMADGDGVPVRYQQDTASHIQLSGDRPKTVVVYVKPGRVQTSLDVVLRSDDRIVRRQRFGSDQLGKILPADRGWIVAIGDTVGIAESLPKPGAGKTPMTVLTLVDDWQQLPDRWIGYEGADVVVLTTGNADQVRQMDAARVAALQRWVQMGGRLILSVGAHGEQLIGEGGLLKPFVPGRFQRVVPLANASDLETHSGSAEPLPLGRDRGASQVLSVSLVDGLPGRLDLVAHSPSGPQPLVARFPLGLGRVVFVTFDLDHQLLARWNGRSHLMGRLLESISGVQRGRQREQQTGRVTHVGYRDLTGQLRTALDQFPDIGLVSFSWVVGLILLYIVLIGPGDYFFLKKVVRRMPLTWLSFPVVVLLFVAVALAVNRQFKGDELEINQVDILDIDAATGWHRGSTWVHLYSPQSQTFSLNLAHHPPGEAASDTGCVFAWHGLPGTGVGGMNTQVRQLVDFPSYEIRMSPSSTTALKDVPVAIGSTKSFFARWWMQTEPLPVPKLRVTPDGLLDGEVTNPLHVALADCAVVYDNWIYRLEQTEGKLDPGQSVQLQWERPVNFEWRLMRRQVRDTSDVMTPWNQASADVPRILEMIMFYEAAGGINYTQLAHRYQGYVDLSGHLDAGSAILWGRSDAAPTTLTVDGGTAQPRISKRWSYYRIVLPVAPGGNAPSMPADTSDRGGHGGDRSEN